MEKVTIKSAIADLREAFLGRIFKNYPDHQKKWDTDEINRAFNYAAYEVALYYIEKIQDAQEVKE